MAFQFTLQALLHLRRSLERQQEMRLVVALQRVARVRQLIEHMDRQRQALGVLQLRDLSSGTTAAELRFGLEREGQVLRHRRELELQLEALRHACEQQRVVFQQARRARETLDAVRDRQLRLYQKQGARREQRDLDEFFLMRREYSRRG